MSVEYDEPTGKHDSEVDSFPPPRFVNIDTESQGLSNDVADDLLAFAHKGQQARAELLVERLELAIDAILEAKLRPGNDDVTAKREVLFELYDREILTRDQVRRRGELDPADFFEELQAYRLRQRPL